MQLTIRISPEARKAIDAIAEKQGWNIRETVDRLCAAWRTKKQPNRTGDYTPIKHHPNRR